MSLSYDGAFGSGTDQQMHVMGSDGWPSATTTSAPSTTSTGSGESPLQAAIEASAWTRQDVELAADVAATAAMLVLAYVAIKGGGV